MTTLNLTANSADQKILLAHLTPLISEVLEEKINNGVKIIKDGKELLSRKTLDTFMEYLIDEIDKMKIAKKYKRANVAGMEGTDIIKHAIHYFEEDSIEGKLFNADGTEYVKPKPAKKYSAVNVVPVASTPPAPKPKPQLSIFDLVSETAESAKPVTPAATVIIDQPKIEQKNGSPMYLHYLSVKEQYKDCIVFYRLGDFYEMFGDDAKVSADVLNLTLTGRDCGLDERVPMTGIPFHAAENYITKLVSAGYKVAVCEPLEGQNERTVNRVITQNPEGKQLVDVETGEIIPEELSVEEMQKFDGDIEETDELMTVSKLIGETPDEEESDDNELNDELPEPATPAELDDDFDLEKERERLKAFDRNAIIILSVLLGNIFTLE